MCFNARMNDWSFWNSSSIALKAKDASPHTSYLFEFLKSYPRRQRSGERLSSIADFQGPSTTGKSRKAPFTWKGAQYSRGFGPVNHACRNTFGWVLDLASVSPIWLGLGGLCDGRNVGVSRSRFGPLAHHLGPAYPPDALRRAHRMSALSGGRIPRLPRRISD
jgi:hypothetical protein